MQPLTNHIYTFENWQGEKTVERVTKVTERFVFTRRIVNGRELSEFKFRLDSFVNRLENHLKKNEIAL